MAIRGGRESSNKIKKVSPRKLQHTPRAHLEKCKYVEAIITLFIMRTVPTVPRYTYRMMQETAAVWWPRGTSSWWGFLDFHQTLKDFLVSYPSASSVRQTQWEMDELGGGNHLSAIDDLSAGP